MQIPYQPGHSGLYVIDCGDKAYIGQIRMAGQQVFIYTGHTGRPPSVSLEDIEEITPIEEHPDIVVCR